MRYYLDTGPLFDYLLLCYAARRRGVPLDQVSCDAPLASKILYLRDAISRRAFANFCSRHKPLYTTPGVVVELYRHARDLRIEQETFWKAVVEEFKELGVSEHLISVVDLTPKGVAQRGPVDEALVALVRRDPRETCIVTGDQRLHGWCKKNEVSCYWVQEIVEKMAR